VQRSINPESEAGLMSLATLNPISFIPTNKPEAARVFYEQTLGLTFVSEDQFALVFRVGPTQTMLLRIVRSGEFTPAPFTIFGWEVTDIYATVAELTAKGVEFSRFSFLEQDEAGIWNAPGGPKVAWFKDPDGNTLSLSYHP
jgi:catechol 2,3-dioxygenase-like lactoylglutathione lyase family enzyme